MNQDIRRKLDHMTRVLWESGVTNPVTYIEQISYLIYLKLLDEAESDRELQARLGGGSGRPLFPLQAERFRWSKWRFFSGRQLLDFVRNEVFPYMASLYRDNPRVADYFRDAVLEIADPNVLKQVIDELDGLEFRRLGPDVKGDIFEYLLTHLGQSALNGQFRTPRQIRACMVAMVDPDLGDTICDPACGTAGFLIDAVDHLLAKYSASPQEIPIYGEDWLERSGLTLADAKAKYPTLQTYRKGAGEKVPEWSQLESALFGVDVSRQMIRIAMMNLVLHGVERAPVKRANALSEIGGLSEEDLKRRYKVILSNPPFAGVLPRESIRQDLPGSSKKSELLFLALMMQSLAPGGRCAVVVPEGLLFGSTGGHIDLRAKLLREFEVQAVVSLPAGVFKPYAGVKTSILVFRRPVQSPDPRAYTTKHVWFYDVKADGYDPDKIQAGGRPETPERNDLPALLTAFDLYRRSGFQQPPGVKTGTILPAGTEPPTAWWAPVETVVDQDFNLAAARYRPTVAETVPDEDPAELARETIALERRIVEGLEGLLGEIEG